MEIEKNVRIVYTRESLIDMVIKNAAEMGYEVKPNAVKFLNKRNKKSDFKTIVVNEVTEQPLSEEEEAAIEIIKEGVDEKKED